MAAAEDGPVRAVLWDADGVLQSNPAGWAEFFGEVLGDRAEAIGTELFGVLDDALTGRIDMRERVATVMAAHGLGERTEQVLAAWRAIDPVPESRELVASLRRASGIASYLATNQDTWRAVCMRELMGYEDLLDGAYYSCEVGLAKPDPAYFEHILADLALPAGAVAFVDDLRANVVAAAEVGLRAVQWHHDEGIEALRERLDQCRVGR